MTLDKQDLLWFGMLRQGGADLSRPRSVRHYLYFRAQRRAEAAAAALDGGRLQVEVRPSGLRWVVVAVERAIVDEEWASAVRPQMVELAGRFGGGYDGWDADVAPRVGDA